MINLSQTISKLSFLASRFQARGLAIGLGLTGGLMTPGTLPLHADWPQILGPTRNGQIASQEPLSTKWPKALTIRWQAPLGSGFGGSAIIGEQVLTLHRTADTESLVAHSLVDGQPLWESKWPATYQGSFSPDEGPRCVPVVAGKFAFCYGAAGDLACVRLSDGERVWLRKLRSELKAEDGYFGAGSTPLAIDDLLIVCLGGKGAGIVALDQTTGETRWKATEHDASYASPIAIPPRTTSLNRNPANAVDAPSTQVLVVCRYDTVLLEAATGKVLSSIRFGSRGPTVNAATPIQLDTTRYFLTASYGVGALTVGIDATETMVEEKRNQSLSSQYNTPVLVGQRLIGIDGREDVGVAKLKALDAATQETLWEQADFGTAHLLAMGPQVLALKLSGELNLIDGSAEDFSLLASSQLPTGTYRALPAYTAKQLILRRTTSPQKSDLLCVELP